MTTTNCPHGPRGPFTIVLAAIVRDVYAVTGILTDVPAMPAACRSVPVVACAKCKRSFQFTPSTLSCTYMSIVGEVPPVLTLTASKWQVITCPFTAFPPVTGDHKETAWPVELNAVLTELRNPESATYNPGQLCVAVQAVFVAFNGIVPEIPPAFRKTESGPSAVPPGIISAEKVAPTPTDDPPMPNPCT